MFGGADAGGEVGRGRGEVVVVVGMVVGMVVVIVVVGRTVVVVIMAAMPNKIMKMY